MPTDAETFAAICADFPFTTEELRAIHSRLVGVLEKARNACTTDHTIKGLALQRLRILASAMQDFKDAMIMIETDGDPEEWIPF